MCQNDKYLTVKSYIITKIYHDEKELALILKKMYRKRKHKKKNKGPSVFNGENCKTGGKKRFGLTVDEMNNLVQSIVERKKNFIVSVQ